MEDIHPDDEVIKVLMLHGYGQSGSGFESKTRTIQRKLSNAIEMASGSRRIVRFYFPTATFRLRSAVTCDNELDAVKDHDALDPDAWTWCQDFAFGQVELFDDSRAVNDLDSGLATVAEVMRQDGPFHGVIGFSSGAAMAALITSLLETDRRLAFDRFIREGRGMAYPESFYKNSPFWKHPPLRFGICYSGFSFNNDMYAGFYNPKITTPILHILGRWDPIVSDRQSLDLIRRCSHTSLIMHHPGSHFVPQHAAFVEKVVSFVLMALSLTADE